MRDRSRVFEFWRSFTTCYVDSGRRHIDIHPAVNHRLKVDMVIIPASTGQMGVLPGHVATIVELKPGIMSVLEGTNVKKYFMSSGFAFLHSNSVADIIAVEVVPLENIDPSQVQKGLA